ncbi:DUF1254 domain-containing protein [Parafrigoribacterium mesophilum]|uniref:DUF1254 domain-containing protein n=1 Tax=Parafrigoribacterium mesophilum TaxID=433646 RepID=UPI0031FE043D
MRSSGSQVPTGRFGMTQISSPNNSVLVIGRVIVENDRDLPAAYALAKQIQLAPLAQHTPFQATE